MSKRQQVGTTTFVAYLEDDSWTLGLSVCGLFVSHGGKSCEGRDSTLNNSSTFSPLPFSDQHDYIPFLQPTAPSSAWADSSSWSQCRRRRSELDKSVVVSLSATRTVRGESAQWLETSPTWCGARSRWGAWIDEGRRKYGEFENVNWDCGRDFRPATRFVVFLSANTAPAIISATAQYSEAKHTNKQAKLVACIDLWLVLNLWQGFSSQTRTLPSWWLLTAQSRRSWAASKARAGWWWRMGWQCVPSSQWYASDYTPITFVELYHLVCESEIISLR